MKLTWMSAALAASATLVSAVPSAVPLNEDSSFDIMEFVSEAFTEAFEPNELRGFDSLIGKRDLTSTMEGVIRAVNKSGIIFIALDQIAYNPSRIEKLANFTVTKVGGIEIGSNSSNFGLKLDVNATLLYQNVMASGVVTGLLDGILLDEDFRPELVALISRILEGNKNIVNYLMKEVFKSLKTNTLSKRANLGTLETFVGNILSTVLSSQLVGDIASDLLVALNKTQILPYTTKKLIANEGYQNMTAQYLIDLFNMGGVKLNSQSINITALADKLLSKPDVIVSIVSNLLTGRVSIPSMGQYSSAVGDIIKQVEAKGVFADVNKYVFSETHSVTTPLIPTNQIVVPKTTTKVATTSSRRLSSSSPTSLLPLMNFSNASQQSAYLASLAGATQGSTKTVGSSVIQRSTTTRGSSATNSQDSESAAEVASILSVLQGMSSETDTDTAGDWLLDTETASQTQTQTQTRSGNTAADTITGLVFLTSPANLIKTTTTTTGNSGGVLGLIQALGGGSSSSSAQVQMKESTPSKSANAASGLNHPNTLFTRVLISVHAILLGGLLFL